MLLSFFVGDPTTFPHRKGLKRSEMESVELTVVIVGLLAMAAVGYYIGYGYGVIRGNIQGWNHAKLDDYNHRQADLKRKQNGQQ